MQFVVVMWVLIADCCNNQLLSGMVYE